VVADALAIHKMRPLLFWLRFWFPLCVYSAIIFLISNLPASQTAGISQVIWDKLLHVMEYSVLGVLAARAFGSKGPSSFQVIWALSVVFCFTYGLSDEFHQSFSLGRESALADAYADFIGGAFGAGIYLFIKQWFIKKEDRINVSA
jgi:VanZ family protein